MTMPESTLGLRIRELRKNAGFSQRELAEKANTPQSYLCNIENGKKEEPSPWLLYDLARILGVSMEFLLTGVGYTPPPTPKITKEKIVHHPIMFFLPVLKLSSMTGQFLSVMLQKPSKTVSMPQSVEIFQKVEKQHPPFFVQLDAGSPVRLTSNIPDGFTVCINQAIPPVSGDLCLVRLNGEYSLAKVFFNSDCSYKVINDKQNYVFFPEDLLSKRFFICGKVIFAENRF